MKRLLTIGIMIVLVTIFALGCSGSGGAAIPPIPPSPEFLTYGGTGRLNSRTKTVTVADSIDDYLAALKSAQTNNKAALEQMQAEGRIFTVDTDTRVFINDIGQWGADQFYAITVSEGAKKGSRGWIPCGWCNTD